MKRRRFPLSGEVVFERSEKTDRGFMVTCALLLYPCPTVKPPLTASPTPPPKGGGEEGTRRHADTSKWEDKEVASVMPSLPPLGGSGF